jgi:8-oxo-dGTP pyrophosphatase MutT (NUDIX family)
MTQPIAHEATSVTRPLVALAILQQGDRFLMQLRDDNPNILYPGHWGFFGGHVEPGETVDMGVRRELLEELGYCPAQLMLHERHEDNYVIRHIYYADLDVDLDQLILGEGTDLALFTHEDIQRGDRYSEKIQQVRPIGEPHQRILLNFIQQNQR